MSATLPPPPFESEPPATPASTNGTATSKHIRIEDRTYFAVSATTEVLKLLVDYVKVIVNLSMLTIDTMSRVIEFLKAFNSRTCQVVLGAGAMRSAGLKNITAKHLGIIPFHRYMSTQPLTLWQSACISVALYNDFADPICARDVSQTPEPETSCYAGRV